MYLSRTSYEERAVAHCERGKVDRGSFTSVAEAIVAESCNCLVTLLSRWTLPWLLRVNLKGLKVNLHNYDTD